MLTWLCACVQDFEKAYKTNVKQDADEMQVMM